MMRLSVPRRPRRGATVTVVIPCYRYGHYLESAVDSVLTQPGVDAQVIIVDDASPDGSGEVAARLARREPRVRAIVHETNRGHIATYNDGLAAVDTEFVSLVSADDVIAPGALGRAVSLMQRHSRVGLVYGAIATFADDDAPRPERTRPYSAWRRWTGDEWIASIAASGYNPIASPEAVLRTSAVQQIGGYTAALPHSGDLEYWLRVASMWDVGQIHGPVQAYYRVHGENMHLTDFGSREADIRERYAAFRVLARPETRAALPTALDRLDTARRTLLAEVDGLLAAAGDAEASVPLAALRAILSSGGSATRPAPITSRSLDRS